MQNDLGDAIRKAQGINTENPRSSSLRLEEQVEVEVHGFYEDIVATSNESRAVRLFSTKETLAFFLKGGPDELLEKRLNEIDVPPSPLMEQFTRTRTRSPRIESGGAVSPSEHPPQRRARRPSVVSILSRSSRDPSPSLRSPTGLQQGEITAPGPAEGTKTGMLNGEVATVKASQNASLHPDYFPAFHPDMLMRQSTNGTDTLVSEASLTHTDRSIMPMEQTNKALDQHAHSDTPTNRTRRGSESMFSQDIRASLSRPGRKDRKFVWIHIPYTNPSWVRKVFNTLEVKERRDFSEVFNPENWSSLHARGRHSQHHACFVKSACKYIPNKLTQELGSPGIASPRNLSPLTSHGCVCLYLPFLNFDTYRTLIKRRDIIGKRLGQGRSKPVPSSVANNGSLEHRIIWEFLGHDPPVNCRRTLDQYRYPSLHDTRARDDDQMLYKMTKERINLGDYGISDGFINVQDSGDITHMDRPAACDEQSPNETAQFVFPGESDADDSEVVDSEQEELRPEDDILDGNILMVDQVWLWVIDKTTLVTFFPKREGEVMEGPLYQQADLRDSIFNEVNGDLTSRSENALDLAALTVLHAVTALIDRTSHPDLEIFRIFEEAISILTEKMTSSLKRFRTAGFRTRYYENEDEPTKTTSIRARHKREDEQAEKDNRDNTSALLELRDIEDELSTLLHLFEEQDARVNDMLRLYPPSQTPGLQRHDSLSSVLPAGDTTEGIAFLQEALDKLSAYKDQTKDMIRRVEKTRHDFDKLLETVQRQAQIDEVRFSRQQADLATAQNRSVMIFTTFTVIFLPLSFFTGLFGMNTQEWGGGDFLHLKTIGAIALPASAVLVVGALVVAWSSSVRKFFKYLRQKAQKNKAKAKRWWLRLVKLKGEPKPRSKQKRQLFRKKREEMEVKKQSKRLKREMTMLDFWERHRLERELQYKIPSRNRKSISIAKSRVTAKTELKARYSR
ncbi:hypothetical protein N0V82_007263 [Gnomoniopsis sp. IMI 355080]|nr:hypothetical protein N0V82_007263 [Gnomoniopsis sp. IMI 355080]